VIPPVIDILDFGDTPEPSNLPESPRHVTTDLLDIFATRADQDSIAKPPQVAFEEFDLFPTSEKPAAQSQPAGIPGGDPESPTQGDLFDLW
jgi:hypothetical protein